jgi:hypothetical protein
MAQRLVLIDELFVSLHVPGGLPERSDRAIRHTLKSRHFLPSLRRALRQFVRQYRVLQEVAITVAR